MIAAPFAAHLLNQLGTEVVRIDGKMVDKPHERAARAVLQAWTPP